MKETRRFLTPAQSLPVMRKYCAYQERCHQEVRTRLLEYGVRGNDLENVMTKLIEEDFLNEERFAIAFARGKFRMNDWGMKKIEMELKMRGVSAYCIRKALDQIDKDDYRKSLHEMVAKKAANVKAANSYARKQKVAQYLVGKGYESELVWEAVNDFFKS
jgi:regulatory protein